MKNTLNFESFIKSLKPTNRNLNFYVDWDKCLKNCDRISISLNHLNFLLGKDSVKIKEAIITLFDEYKKAFEILPLLLAVRNSKGIVLDKLGSESSMQEYLKSPQGVYDFICESRLLEIFADKKIKDLNDFVFGIEVGLDSNARKNRSGKAMESLIAKIFKESNLYFKEQIGVKEFEDLRESFGDDIKKFDFVIFGKNKQYFIECNFYTGGGSKLNETARAYIELAQKFENFKDKQFVWITDGQGWLNAKNKLQEAYKSVEIYNLSNISDFIQKAQNDC
ncbi:MAG TPA: type II restriction endonuclease [Candidatus Helicobacter avicola]|nr:type II restriction endonuclease [Candidatus Helicobacter avicola]